jgi:putative transposase
MTTRDIEAHLREV